MSTIPIGWRNTDMSKLTDEEEDGYHAAIGDSAVRAALAKTDWALLAEQKAALIETLVVVRGTDTEGRMQGLLNFIDALQDAAEKDGFPVVWLSDDELDDIDTQGADQT